MIQFDLPKQKSSIIKVLGVGGGGSNAVNFMFSQDVDGCDFIICNTDAKALEQSSIPNKIQLGPHLTQGLGAGANPMVGKHATEESLEEIKRILEVNTKMAFVCAGMGGGTGTGGAPIIAKICRELGILTVGIVTLPFGFEGPRRLQQAESGIKELEPYVDTLLVISNDKLRMQYGNLKMREAFSKADNVLATAAKCITDIINSRGHIIVDFADVCTVMKNGGVAILGSSSVEGEDRAQRAIEEALNSPLLNDNDIRGAKWILININSAEGDDEATMDEVEIINNYLRQQAGDHTDVIMGTGYDNSLGKKIGITLIATGFEHKDPFTRQEDKPREQVKEERIIMSLDLASAEDKKVYNQQPLPFEEKVVDPYAPKMSEAAQPPVFVSMPQMRVAANEAPVYVALQTEEPKAEVKPEPAAEVNELGMQLIEKPMEQQLPAVQHQPLQDAAFQLRKPVNIYAEAQQAQEQLPQQSYTPPEPLQPVPQYVQPQPAYVPPVPPAFQQPAMPQPQPQPVMPEATPVRPNPIARQEQNPEEEQVEFGFLIKNDAAQPQAPVAAPVEFLEEDEEQKRKAAERIQKLRSLSFNMSSAENSEFDSVPAYVRRNMELFGNTLTTVENFYSKYSVKPDENNDGPISTINTFLDGKKPD
jgi:cell division protein FtsZ